MKKTGSCIVYILSGLITAYSQNVGIGTISPHSSARLEINSTSKGLLIPRVTAAQRESIVSPAEGLMVYSLTDSVFYVYRSRWKKMSFRLPYTDSLQSTQTLLHIVSNGSGFGIMGENRNNSIGVIGITQSVLPNPSFFPIGVYGSNFNTGSSLGYGVYGEHLGSGIAMYGYSENGIGGKFTSVNGIALQAEGKTVLNENVAIADDAQPAHASAALDIRSSAKGILFPRMSSAQKDAISNPADGLHVFDTDQRSLNYYDSLNAIWNCYNNDCKTEIIKITANTCKLDFYNAYAKDRKANRYLVIIEPGVTISGCAAGDTALSFINLPANTTVTIRNYGTITGAGGNGGVARLLNGPGNPCPGYLSIAGTNGFSGGHAICTKTGVNISVTNYGTIAGGGGGGGAGSSGYGGGGGGGAGTTFGEGGTGGVSMFYSLSFPIGCNATAQSQSGFPGTATAGGIGGIGAPGAGNGGTGGARGQPGSPGSDNLFTGGSGGKAIAGGSGNSLTNIGAGQSFGLVD